MGVAMTMPTRDLAGPAWRDYGQVIVVDSLDEAYTVADELAFEHVEVLTEQPQEALEALSNYGALFLGEGTCASYGDKVIGTNHVLPTRRGPLYRRVVGGQVPEDSHVPGGNRHRRQRHARRAVWAGGAGRGLRGPCEVGRRQGQPELWRSAGLGTGGRRRPSASGRGHDGPLVLTYCVGSVTCRLPSGTHSITTHCRARPRPRSTSGAGRSSP